MKPQSQEVGVEARWSDADRDQWLRTRLQAAVDQLAGGSADKMGRLLGYANGGFLRDILSGKREVRRKVIQRMGKVAGGQTWFDNPNAKSSETPSHRPKRAIDLDEAISILAEELAKPLDDDVRVDVSDALKKLALRSGAARDRQAVLRLLREK